MLKKMFGLNTKIVKAPDTSELDIRMQCAAINKVFGVFNNHNWNLTLCFVNGHTVEELPNAPARFNQENANVAFWLDMNRLNDFVAKRQANYDWMQKGNRTVDMPYAPATLADSAACACEFTLRDLINIIKTAEKTILEHGGKLPETPSLLPYKQSATPFKLYIKVDWRKNDNC